MAIEVRGIKEINDTSLSIWVEGIHAAVGHATDLLSSGQYAKIEITPNVVPPRFSAIPDAPATRL